MINPPPGTLLAWRPYTLRQQDHWMLDPQTHQLIVPPWLAPFERARVVLRATREMDRGE